MFCEQKIFRIVNSTKTVRIVRSAKRLRVIDNAKSLRCCLRFGYCLRSDSPQGPSAAAVARERGAGGGGADGPGPDCAPRGSAVRADATATRQGGGSSLKDRARASVADAAWRTPHHEARARGAGRLQHLARTALGGCSRTND